MKILDPIVKILVKNREKLMEEASDQFNKIFAVDNRLRIAMDAALI